MEVNRNNYEEKIIDHLDGKLPAGEVDALFAFLSQHPDLMDEYILLAGTENIETTIVPAPFKNDLKRTRADIISDEKLNHLIVAQLENVQTEEERKELARILAIDPSINNEIVTFNKTILVADDTVQFPHKNELKRTRTLYEPLYYYAAAAIIVILLSIPFLIKQHTGETGKVIATANQNHIPVTTNNRQVITSNNSSKLEPVINTEEKNRLFASNKKKSLIQKNIEPTGLEVPGPSEITTNESLPMIDPNIKSQPIEENILLTSANEIEISEPAIIQENKVANYVSTGNKILERLFNKKLPVTYTYKENQSQKAYVLAAGGFEFSRSRSKKNQSQN
jgi:hypothetical protein